LKLLQFLFAASLLLILFSRLVLYNDIFFASRKFSLIFLGLILVILWSKKLRKSKKKIIIIVGVLALIISLPTICYNLYFYPLSSLFLIYPIAVYYSIAILLNRTSFASIEN